MGQHQPEPALLLQRSGVAAPGLVRQPALAGSALQPGQLAGDETRPLAARQRGPDDLAAAAARRDGQLSRRALLAAALAAVLALGGGASAGTAGAAGAAHHHGDRAGAQAFLLTSSPDSLADLRAHAGAISVVYPTYFECTPGGGSVAGADVPAIDSFAHSRGDPGDAPLQLPGRRGRAPAAERTRAPPGTPRAARRARPQAGLRGTVPGPRERRPRRPRSAELVRGHAGGKTPPPPPPARRGGGRGHPRRARRPVRLLRRPRAVGRGGHRVRDGVGYPLGGLGARRHLHAVARERRGRAS